MRPVRRRRTTLGSGQKVFLTWDVPLCNYGCQSGFIGDGTCDRSCHVAECRWDGGDCEGVDLDALDSVGLSPYASKKEACAESCLNKWVGDRFCDEQCMVRRRR
jgi:UDP-N-acetylglucosamine-lysosomal-enzyme